jgi:amidase
MFELAGPAVRKSVSPVLKAIEALAPETRHISVSGGELESWRNAFRIIQSAEAWDCHGDWITRVRPQFGPGVRERFAGAAMVDAGDVQAARKLRELVRTRIAGIIGPGSVLVAPTAPGPAPLRTATGDALEAFRARALALLCPAGHCGLPQVSIPAGTVDGAPIGLSLIGLPGEDGFLLDLACRIAEPTPGSEASHV